MIKMVASDLDGTLLVNGSQSIPEEIFPLIKKLKDMGILFVAASGRQYANMRNLFAPVKDDMAFIGKTEVLQFKMRNFFTVTVLTKACDGDHRSDPGKKTQSFPVPQKIFIISCQKQSITVI